MSQFKLCPKLLSKTFQQIGKISLASSCRHQRKQPSRTGRTFTYVRNGRWTYSTREVTITNHLCVGICESTVPNFARENLSSSSFPPSIEISVTQMFTHARATREGRDCTREVTTNNRICVNVCDFTVPIFVSNNFSASSFSPSTETPATWWAEFHTRACSDAGKGQNEGNKNRKWSLCQCAWIHHSKFCERHFLLLLFSAVKPITRHMMNGRSSMCTT